MVIFQGEQKNVKALHFRCAAGIVHFKLASCIKHLQTLSCCQRCFTNFVDHCIHECIYLNRQRARLFQEIFSLGADIHMHLFMQDKHSQTNLLLGVECPEFLQILSDRAETFNSIRLPAKNVPAPPPKEFCRHSLS